MYHSLFIHSLPEEHFAHFQVLAIMNKADTTSMCWVLCRPSFQLLWINKYQGAQLLDCMVGVCLVFVFVCFYSKHFLYLELMSWTQFRLS